MSVGEPAKPLPPDDPARKALADAVAQALKAIPAYFRTTTHIQGVDAGDLFNLNAVLGSSIEIQVVATLNTLRRVWDPSGRWSTYAFERSAQTFPDVRLISHASDSAAVAIGIELKGWYLLSKEQMPSFRYLATPAACDVADLLVVVPWHLEHILAGVPVVHTPYIESARWVAEYRNHWWASVRKSHRPSIVRHPIGQVTPYPSSKLNINDRAEPDDGGNFGRVARIGIMDDYIRHALATRIAGIAADDWILFLKAHVDSERPEVATAKVLKGLRLLRADVTDDEAESIRALLAELGRMLAFGSDA